MNKKGNLLDPVDTISVILTVVITALIVITVNQQFHTKISAIESVNSTTEGNNSIEWLEDYNNRLLTGSDYIVMFIMILFPIFSFFAAKKIEASGINVVIYFLMMAFILIGSFVASNIYGAMIDNATLLSTSNSFRFIPLIMEYLPYYILVYIIVVSIGFFGKPEGG